MDKREHEMLEILRSNRGFLHPERWIKYGLSHNFVRIQADELNECPDCKCQSFSTVGQYVYYSTLMALRECRQCGLVFVDKRIDPEVIQRHFEHTYKDDIYFLERRHRIFEQISILADLAATRGGFILDVGGAKGHLLARLQKRRPDLRLVVHDLSKEACELAAHIYGFQTICGDIRVLEKVSSKFEVIIMSDVIYYEPALCELWRILPNIISKNGTVIIRVPNKLSLIRSWQTIIRVLSRRVESGMQEHIKFFNPEHIYVFPHQYLSKRLRRLGFAQVTTIPSELLGRNRFDFWHPAYFYVCKLLFVLTCGKMILTPSILVIGKGFQPDNGATRAGSH